MRGTMRLSGRVGRADAREVALRSDLRAALVKLNPQFPLAAIKEAIEKLTRHDFSRSLATGPRRI
jgi:type I restriction enzyme, R subunit